MKYIQMKRRGKISRPEQLVHASSVGIQYGPDGDQIVTLKFNPRTKEIYLESRSDRMLMMPHGGTNIEICFPNRPGEGDDGIMVPSR